MRPVPRALPLLLLLASCAGPGGPDHLVLVSFGGEHLEIAWRADSGVPVHVYRAPTAAGNYLRLTGEPILERRFRDRGFPPGTPVFYRIRTVDPDGRESSTSEALTVVVPGRDFTPPPAPVLTSKPRKTRSPSPVTYGLAEPFSTVDFVVGRHVVGSCAVGPEGRWTFRLEPRVLPEGTYEFSARCRDAAGLVSPDAAPITVVVDLTRPDPPANLRTTTARDHVLVEWDPSPSPDVAYYDILRKEGGGTWQEVAAVRGATQFLDREVRAGTSYAYRVIPVDDSEAE